MATIQQRITNCLWFNTQAEEAVRFYTSIFPNSSVGVITRYGKEGFEHHGMPEGSVLTVSFKLDGQDFLALNGGPVFNFNEAISLIVNCDGQKEVDYYWDKLTEGGTEVQCGWLKDRYGLSWQVVPVQWVDMVTDKDPQKVHRAMEKMFTMKKLDVEVLQKAFDGRVQS
jgi:predicted 3-demethylubiquinone-9 3-methyltransferase (glyoxalase superfamily)